MEQNETTEETKTTETTTQDTVETATTDTTPEATTDDTNKSEVKVRAVSFYKNKADSYKSELDSVKTKLQELENERKAAQESKMIEEKRFEELYKAEKKRAETAELRAQEVANNFNNNIKHEAIKNEAISRGMDAKYLKYLDYNTQLVQLETTSTGRVNVLGVEDYIKEFAEENDIFFGKGAAPRINTSRVGTTDTQEITAKDLIRLEKENPEKYREMMKKRLRLA